VFGREPARILIGQGVSCIDVPGYDPSHTLRTPASLEFGDPRRASVVRRVRVFQDRRDLSGRTSRGCPPMSPSWPGVSRLAWRASRGVVCTNSGGLRPDRIQRPAVRTRSGGSGMTTTTGPGGGAALGGEASVAPPPIFCPVEPEPATIPASGEHCELPVDAGYGASPAARQRVVLLPHARTEPANTRPDNRCVGRPSA
jgi:hypothetical protein